MAISCFYFISVYMYLYSQDFIEVKRLIPRAECVLKMNWMTSVFFQAWILTNQALCPPGSWMSCTAVKKSHHPRQMLTAFTHINGTFVKYLSSKNIPCIAMYFIYIDSSQGYFSLSSHLLNNTFICIYYSHTPEP